MNRNDGHRPRALLLGHPVRHSLSPRIMSTLSGMTGAKLEYHLLDVAPQDLPRALKTLESDPSVVGLNFTLPHKGAGASLAKKCTPEVTAIGSANMWARTKEGFCAHNTDGPGFLEALHRLGISLAGTEIVMVGAGGAARGVAYACLSAGASRIWVWNRTRERARQLCRIAPDRIHVLEDPGEMARNAPGARLVIHATSLGLQGADRAQLDALIAPLRAWFQGAMATDLVYRTGAGETPFLEIARSWGLGTVDCGRSMLILQAVIAFNLWMGTEIPGAAALDALLPELHET